MLSLGRLRKGGFDLKLPSRCPFSLLIEEKILVLSLLRTGHQYTSNIAYFFYDTLKSI